MVSEAIRLKEAVKIYHQPGSEVGVQALGGVSLAIEQSESVAIVGVSGSGKSTLLNIIGCLDRLSAGSYRLYGEDVSQLGDDELSDVRGARIGFVFQNFNLIQSQTVLENLEVPMFYRGGPAHVRRARALDIAERVGLTDRLNHRPSELSGGEQQRVAIARALMNEPVVLLADEPTGNLDSKTGKVILDLLADLNKSGTTLVLVTHDRDVAGRCRRTVELQDGRVYTDSVGGGEMHSAMLRAR